MLATLPELLDRANALVSRLESAGVTIKPSSRFRSYVRELEAAVPLQFGMPPNDVARRWHRLLIEIGDLERIVDSLGSAPEVSGWKSRVEESLSGSFFRTDEANHSRARDIQFELVLAAEIRKSGFEPSFAEPDVVVDIASNRVAIAAKRPRSRAKLQKVVKEAGKQILKQNLNGVIAIDVSVVANPDDKHITTRDFTSTQAFVATEASNLGKYIGATAGQRFGTARIFAVLVRLACPIWEPAERRMSYANQWPIVCLVGSGDPRQQMCQQLFRGFAAA